MTDHTHEEARVSVPIFIGGAVLFCGLGLFLLDWALQVRDQRWLHLELLQRWLDPDNRAVMAVLFVLTIVSIIYSFVKSGFRRAWERIDLIFAILCLVGMGGMLSRTRILSSTFWLVFLSVWIPWMLMEFFLIPMHPAQKNQVHEVRVGDTVWIPAWGMHAIVFAVSVAYMSVLLFSLFMYAVWVF